MTKPVQSSLTPGTSAADLATSVVAAGQAIRNELHLDSDLFDIDRDVGVGDQIYVFDPDSDMVDTTNPVHYRGALIYPIKVRVLAATWPIERAMDVWYRNLNG